MIDYLFNKNIQSRQRPKDYNKIINANSLRFVSRKKCQHFQPSLLIPISFFFIPSYHSSLGNMALPMLRLSGLILSTQQHSFSFQPCHHCTTGQAASLAL